MTASTVQSAAPPPPPPQESGRGRSPPAAVSALRSMPLPRLPADLVRLLETTADEDADVEFEVGGRVFAAHNSVLAARSPVFMEELFGGDDQEEATRYVRVSGMHPDTFEALLHYLYTDTLPPAAVLAPVTGGGGAQRAAAAGVLVQDLVRAADRYGLGGLKSLAEIELCRHDLAVDTVLPTLALAERHRCWELKSKCLEFVAASGENARAVVMATDGDDVEHLARSCPSVVKELIVKVLEAMEAAAATPTARSRPVKEKERPDAAFFFYQALGFVLALILPFGMLALMDWGYLEHK